MAEVSIKIHGIHNLKFGTQQTTDKDGVTKDITRLSFETDIHPTQLARILNLQRQRQPIDVVMESPQAKMDLTFQPVDVTTGEIPIEKQ
jgi:hypothetical protein